jgi:hypothetical protein
MSLRLSAKRLLPERLRYRMWWLIKSPKRKNLGLKTLLLTDIKGACRGRRPGGKPVVFVCTAVYNRSKPLLSHLIGSLSECDDRDRIVLCIADNGSLDVPDLRRQVEERWKGELRWVDVEKPTQGPFNKSRVLNAALRLADGGIVAVCDADLSVPRHFVRLCESETGRYRAWFPRLMWEEMDGRLREYSEGCGVAIFRHEVLETVGLLDESFVGWGREDWEWYYRFYRRGIQAARSLEPGLVHHYHERKKWPSFP